MDFLKIRNAVVNKIIIFCLFLISISSCRQVLTEKEAIIGDWYPIDTIYGMKSNLTGYEFREDGLCINKLGFLEYVYIDTASVLSKPMHEPLIGEALLCNVIRFWGNTSVYRIESDSLKIFDPSLRAWSEYKVSFRTKDTMVLSCYNDSIVELYIRKRYTTVNDVPLFDQIILTYPDVDYSSFKIFSIQRDGSFFSKENFDQKLQVAKTNRKEFEHIESLFKKSDIRNTLKELSDNTSAYSKEYKPRWNRWNSYYKDDVVMTIISENKMYTIDGVFNKTYYDIQDVEFFWAFVPALYTPQTISSCPEQQHEESLTSCIFDNYTNLYFINEDDKEIRLYISERFYLATLLYHANITEQPFVPIYKLHGILNNEAGVETDGRYFSIKYCDSIDSENVNKSITLDIGFNFIEWNELE